MSHSQSTHKLPPNAKLQLPLSRRGKGPGLVIIIPDGYASEIPKDVNRTLDPEPTQKWAEESFAVVEYIVDKGNTEAEIMNDLDSISHFFRSLPESQEYGGIGAIVYDICIPRINDFVQKLRNVASIAAIIVYSNQSCSSPHPIDSETSKIIPLLIHSSVKINSEPNHDKSALYVYESVRSPNFVLPTHQDYVAGAAGVAHTRSVGFMKEHLNGPHFDLESIWDEHTKYEFGDRDVEKTMSTMVAEPYVNHVPTMTGGIGRSALTSFYAKHFIFSNPEDTQLELISRTVGVDRVIDEFIFSFTHDRVIDWLLPGVPPTFKHVQIPFTSVVNVRGDCLYHEHIAWDQASVLRQLGLLPEYLPFPYPLPDGRKPGPGKRFEYRLPVSGVDTARKMVDENSVPSNEMLGFDIREVDDV